MPSIFSLIGQAWAFARRQPVIGRIALWLFVLPAFILNSIGTVITAMPRSLVTQQLAVLVGLLTFLLTIVTFWGAACVLLVGRRLVKSNAGRARTSFAAVRKEASAFIVPLLLTGVLRTCVALLWSVLFIIPGIVYSIRTAFYHVVIVCEGVTMRPALRRSQRITSHRFWRTIGYILGLAVILFLPVFATTEVLASLGEPLGLPLLLSLDFANAVLGSVASILFALSMILLYVEFKRNSNVNY